MEAGRAGGTLRPFWSCPDPFLRAALFNGDDAGGALPGCREVSFQEKGAYVSYAEQQNPQPSATPPLCRSMGGCCRLPRDQPCSGPSNECRLSYPRDGGAGGPGGGRSHQWHLAERGKREGEKRENGV